MWFCGWASLVKRRIAPACEGGVALVPRFPPHYKVAPRLLTRNAKAPLSGVSGAWGWFAGLRGLFEFYFDVVHVHRAATSIPEFN